MFDIDHNNAVKDFLTLVRISPFRTDLSLLTALTQAFLRFPYENLTKILRAHEEPDPAKRLRTPEVVLDDHINIGAGGTCFSLTYFFHSILSRCGFNCYPVLCDRSYGPDTHCALITKVGTEEYLVDPGYLLQYPLRIPERGSSATSTPLGRVALTRLGDTSQYLLSTHVGGKSNIRYRMKKRDVNGDLFHQRWIDSFSWAQMRHLCITSLKQDGRIYIRDFHLRHMSGDRRTQTKIKQNYEKIVSETFGLNADLIERALNHVRSGERRYG